MSTRKYVSTARADAVDKRREDVIKAAGDLLRDEANVAAVSLDAVAKTAGVTRLTVYKQFGSRRGLFEAVFDERARQGGLGRIAQAMAMADPRQALGRLIEIFCDFWADDAVGRLQDATATDPEFAQAVAERNERRRQALRVLVGRIAPASRERPADYRDAVDVIFGLTSYPMFRTLRQGRTPEAVCGVLTSACNAILAGITEP
jgi:AcrR family transcriptional regulator